MYPAFADVDTSPVSGFNQSFGLHNPLEGL
jgi:hypothetical protein